LVERFCCAKDISSGDFLGTDKSRETERELLLEDRFFLLVVGVQFDKKVFNAVWALGNQIRLLI
jgi:hypothetical protein